MKLRRCSGTAAAAAAAKAAKAANCRVGVRSAAAAAAVAEEEEGVDAVTVRWLQYAGLQHLASPGASADQRRRLRSLLAQGYGAEIAEGNQILSSLLRNLNFSSTQSCTDAYDASRTTEQDVATEFIGKLGTGLLDLHAVDDTELLSENLMAELFNPSLFAPSRGPSNDFDSVIREQQNLQGQPDCNYRASVGAKEKKVAKIRVVVRKRPRSKEEISRKEGDIITVDDNSHITIHQPKLKVDLTAYEEKHRFHFDAVLDENVTSDEVYRVTVEPIVPTIFQQGKVTCFAFGQTGSGKTFTMQPLPLRASEEIFRLLRQTNSHNQNLKLWLSYFEIYCGNLFDLLNDRRKLCMREDGHQQVCIVGLQEYEVSDVQIVEELIQKGNSVRLTGSTGANDESSRSHAILQLTIKNHDDVNDTRRNSKKRVAKDGKLVGKISFIDLAGTERGADSVDNDRIKRTEGAEINKGLMALKECIRALDSDQIHISFRGSKLTEVLRDSFVGNTRTVVIACISPSTGSCEPTLNTLRYADRFKSLSKGSYSAKEYSAIAEEESPLASSLRFLVESEDIYEQDNAEAEHTTIFGRKIENNVNDPVPENGRNSFRFEPNYDYSRREVGGTSLNVLEIYQHNAQNTSSGYKTHATAQFSPNIYYKEKPKRKEKHSCSSKNCGSMVSPKGYEKQQMHGSSSSTVVCLYGEEINTKFEEKDDLISSRRSERENIRDIACDVYSTTKSLSSESNSLSCVIGWNDAQSTCGDSSTYESDLTTQRSSDIHENENVPRVSSPSRNLMRDEKSKIRSNSSMRESRSKMAPKSHTKNQIHDPCSNTWASRYEEEAPSQDSMSERDSNLSSFMFEDNSNERKEDGIAYDTLEMGRNNTQNTHGCTSNIDKPDFSTRDINTAVEEESRRVPTYSEQTKTTDSFSSEYGNNSSGTEDGGPRSPTLEMGQNDIGSSYRNNSIYKSDSSMHGTLNLNDRENSPTVSSPSGELNEGEKSEIQISTKEDRASKLFPKSSGEVQMHNRGSNISVSLHEEEAPSQERDINREEDALISAHVNLLENTMNIMHEEMKLLVEVDKPGNPIDKYVARLSLLLSRKAADLASLQKGLVKFQLRLQEDGILRNSSIP